MTTRRHGALLAPLFLLALAACQRGGWSGDNPAAAAPVDTARVHAAEVGGWGYRREVSADLDGDGKLERLVIAADVAMGPTGPLWGNANRWAVYVEPANGERTLLYGALVPNGFTEAAVLSPDKDGRRKVLVQERTTDKVRTMEVEYDRGKARLDSASDYQVGEWLPGAAAMR
ncbi:MAG TPA: hypothetical protein VK123_02980 [Candidatus Limnocylindrales bacterium]|nr:hypothetical protein [Candidatus Limnocylindrales bacterium]